MTQTSNIETNRLVLRPFSESDAPDVFESCTLKRFYRKWNQ